MYLFTMPMNKVKLGFLAALLAALAVTGVAAAGTNLSLVGYSTPKAVIGKIVQAWQQTPDGKDTSGRNATNTFLSGKGDVLLTYESEALNARLNGQDIQYVIPRQTMLIELPIAVLKNSSNKDLANKFIQFVKQPTAQDLFAQYGFRPVNPVSAKKAASKFPARPGIFKIDDKLIGGWRNADKVWFDPNKGRMVKIEQAVGGPTSG